MSIRGSRHCLPLLAIGCMVGCNGLTEDATPAIKYTPPLIPVEISLNGHGKVTVSVSKTFSTPIGSFELGVEVPVNSDPHIYRVVIRDHRARHRVVQLHEFKFSGSEVQVFEFVGANVKLMVGARKAELEIRDGPEVRAHRDADAPQLSTLQNELRSVRQQLEASQESQRQAEREARRMESEGRLRQEGERARREEEARRAAESSRQQEQQRTHLPPRRGRIESTQTRQQEEKEVPGWPGLHPKKPVGIKVNGGLRIGDPHYPDSR
jgi:hypothetical protein